MVVCACHLSTWEAETGGSQVCGQSQQPCEAFCNLGRPCFEIKNKMELGVELGGRMSLGSIPPKKERNINKKAVY